MKNILTYLFLILISYSAIAQKGKETKGLKYSSSYSYEKSIKKLEGISNKSTSINRILADSYLKTGNLEKAEEYYASVVNATDKTPEDLYNYASVLRMNKKYSDSDEWMKKYHQLNTSDTRGIEFNDKQGYYKTLEKDNGQFRITNLDINTAQSDFGASYYKNQIVFASSREGIVQVKRRWNWNGLAFLNLYVANNNGVNELSDVQVFNSKFNGKYHEGPASFSKDANFMVYTKDNYQNKDSLGVRRLELFYSEYINDKWTKPQSISLNNPQYSVGQASLTSDGKTMYFVSDMPGGIGGADIYKTTRNTDNTWTKPINLGPKINTEGNETFPSIHESEKMLFFASDGKVGLGGLDIFVAQLTNGEVGKVENLGAPINTNSDDFAFTLDANEKGGFFSSNREGGKGDDDIYSFKLIKPFVFGKTIKGTAKDKNDNILADATVVLYNSNNEVVDSVKTNDKGEYLFLVDADKDFKLTGVKTDYFDGETTANTKTDDNIITADIVLEKDPGLSLYGLITDKETSKALEGVSVILIDNMTGKETLNMQTTTNGDFRQALTGKKLNDRLSYQVKLEKDGYLGKSLTFNKEITQPGEIKMATELDLSLEKIAVGADLAKIIDIKPIYFDVNKYNIRKDASIELDKIVKVMNENPTMEIELGSHTDSRGSNSSNLRLSDKRAKASAAYIVKQGIDKSRITGKGYGESKPITINKETNKIYPYFPVGQVMTEKFINSFKAKSKNKFKEGHQLNRRTEFIIVKM